MRSLKKITLRKKTAYFGCSFVSNTKTMETLKLKIFNVLTEKIKVTEFENWLNSSEEFMNQINSNSFYFDVVSINYKNNEWRKNLCFFITPNYSNDLLALIQTETICAKIIISKNITNCYNLLFKLVSELSSDFICETEYNVVHNFHSLYCRYDLIELGYMTNSEFILQAKFLASLFLNKISNSKTLDEKINILKINLKKDETSLNDSKKTLTNQKKHSLKQKTITLFKNYFAN